MIKILGAGLAGLTAAINLAEKEEVTIYEKNSDVGKQIHQNVQCLLGLDGKVREYLKRFNLNPKFTHFRIENSIFCTQKRDLHVKLKTPADFILRGGKGSLEYGLYEQAKEAGVKFKFNETINDAKIVSTGPYKCDMLAYGEIFNDLNLPKNTFFYMHDDRFSPIGWYFYIVPLPDGKFEAVNCTSVPYTNKTKELFDRAIKERPALKDIIGNNKPVGSFGGMGSFEFKRQRIIDGKLYVGEAAGFQDAMRGFGIKYAIESGYVAARSIKENKDYEKLWREQFLKQFKIDTSRRGIVRLLGSKTIEILMKKVEDGGTVDWDKTIPAGIKQTLMTEVFYRYELYKKWRTGYW